jgi:hypothetical protein
VIVDERRVDDVAVDPPQRIRGQPNHAVVAHCVVIGAKNDHVLGDIRAIVRTAKWTNMVSLGVPRPVRKFDCGVASLTAVVMFSFLPSRRRPFSDSPVETARAPTTLPWARLPGIVKDQCHLRNCTRLRPLKRAYKPATSHIRFCRRGMPSAKRSSRSPRYRKIGLTRGYPDHRWLQSH